MKYDIIEKMKKRFWLIILIVILFIVGLIGGTAYWSIKKIKNIANSAFDASKNIKWTRPWPR